ncbi:hypothetical protein C8A01DRAFT_47124 [Parachaetomium inaequale]|uniref:Heterokaryon incompatibility domain-containing protein n=1 Tax=Parachaetomium inaequale TaxID=2588326 RepID=A0AAN6PHR2_9PEZI|nr:hypothetical protein C8A01DRAFT_47124 [Parachaetomium inaequale]
MAGSGSLCAWCNKVPLDTKALRDPDGDATWDLGTISRIQGNQSNCPLCRLVLFALYKDAHASSGHIRQTPDTEVSLIWRTNSSLNNGPAFRVQFRVVEGIIQSLELYFVKSSEESFQSDAAFCLLPNYGQALDLGRVRRWLSQCTNNHGGDCGATPWKTSSRRVDENFPGLERLRFVDVLNECVVESRLLKPYVALSYVWGLGSSLRLTTWNQDDLTRQYGLRDNLIELPRTIRDAMTFVKGIGQQYLFSRGVNVMDVIYEGALLTIVAASGHDANRGLPGVGEGSRFMPRYPEEIIPGVRLDAYIELDQVMKFSVHSSRAWTFQEEILSRRLVYFVDDKVYFRCRSTTLFEFGDPGLDTRLDRPEGTVASILPAAIHMLDPVPDFRILLLYYSKRALTYQMDGLRAMAGITRRVSERMKCRFLEGLPTAAFDLFVVFRRHHSPLYRREGLPSYSWAGWRGSLLVVELGENDFLKDHTWIVWYRLSPRGVTSLVWDPVANNEFPLGDLEYVGYRGRRTFKPPFPLPFPTSRTQPTENVVVEARSYPILQFWTLSMHFNLRITNRILGVARITDRHGTTCGALYPDGLDGAAFFNSPGPFELIALSATRADLWTWYDSELRSIFEDPNLRGQEDGFYNVMVLEWSGPVAERRGIGLLRQDAVVQSLHPGLAWKEIFLA